jgi:glycerophosphoryl diester phosphodiesterase
VRIIGHRGARAEAPENTLAGFAHALAAGVAGIETDIAMTADFIPVLHHDAALADGQLICRTARADLPGHVPDLAAALALAPAGEWLLEVKTYPERPDDAHAPDVVVAQMLAVLAGFPQARLSILAFDWAVLRAVAARAPGLRRVCLTTPKTAARRGLWWGGYERLRTPRAVAAAGAQGWAAYQAALTAAAAAEAKALGLERLAWTVNEDADFARLSPLVDAIITDRPTYFLRRAREGA